MDDLTWSAPHRSTMTRAQRAAILLDLVDRFGWTLEFVTHPDRNGRPARSDRVHVAGPDEDQPRAATAAEALAWKRIRTVCGQVIYLTAMEGRLGVPFVDDLLCQACHAAFGSRQAVLFEHNVEGRIGHSNQDVRLLVEFETDPAWQRLMNAPIQFWVCPVEGHSNRRGPDGGPVLTVDWRGNVAHCTAAGCGRTSTDRGGGDDDAASGRAG